MPRPQSGAPKNGDLQMTDLTPREIVSELDRFIIGQKEAKRAVAVALRSRWRRRQLGAEIRDEVYPKNILMIGPDLAASWAPRSGTRCTRRTS